MVPFSGCCFTSSAEMIREYNFLDISESLSSLSQISALSELFWVKNTLQF